MATENTPAAKELGKTEFGIPIDDRFARAASEDQIQRAATSLRSHQFVVEVVDTASAAKELVFQRLPRDQQILTTSSETTRLSGLADEINGSGKVHSLRSEVLAKLDPKTQYREMVKLGATPDVAVGSAHAVTEDGQIVVASASGSQLGPYSAGAGRVFLLVGAQKVVPDLATAMRRLETYAFPKEDIRAHAAYGRGSAMAKILILRQEMTPERVTVVLIREPIGY